MKCNNCSNVTDGSTATSTTTTGETITYCSRMCAVVGLLAEVDHEYEFSDDYAIEALHELVDEQFYGDAPKRAPLLATIDDTLDCLSAHVGDSVVIPVEHTGREVWQKSVAAVC